MREEDTDNPGGKLRRIRALGYQCIELAGRYGMPTKEWKHILEETGLAVVGAHVPLEDLVGRFDEEVEFHHAIGNTRIVVPALPKDNRVYDGFVRSAQVLEQLGQGLADNGLQLLYHNHDFEFREFDDGRTGMDILFGGTDPDHVGFEIDVGWVETAGISAPEFLRENATRVRALHLKEIRRRDGALVPIGQGDIEFDAIVPLAIKNQWPMIVEYEGGAASSAVKMSADHIHRIIETIA